MYTLHFSGQNKDFSQDGKYSLGRGQGSDVICDDSQASRNHGEFLLERGQLSYRDLESTNGSRLDGRGLSPFKWEILAEGQVLSIGNWEATVNKTEAPAMSDEASVQIALPKVDPAGPAAARELTQARQVPEDLRNP